MRGDDFACNKGYKSILTQYFFRKSLQCYKMLYIHTNIQGPSYSSKNSFRKYISTRSAFIVKSRGELKQEGKEMTKRMENPTESLMVEIPQHLPKCKQHEFIFDIR